MTTSRTPAVDEVVIRPEAEVDLAAIRVVVAAAFGSDTEADLVERIRASPHYVPEMALVAQLHERVVGHVMISGATVRTVTGDHPIVMLSPLAVDPPHHRQGIGSRLVADSLAAADRRGHPFVVLEGDPAYYGRFGFEPAARHGLVLPLPDWAPPEAAQLRALSAFDPDDPALRGDVVYPSAFDGLE